MLPAATRALEELWTGNARFRRGESRNVRRDPARRSAVAACQTPWAAIVGCSDSRVPPEIIFDQGLGDLFVVRLAGNVVDRAALGSLEYAAEHLAVPLLVVLGHTGCGAVGAAVRGDLGLPHLDGIVEAIRPAVEATAHLGGDRADHASRAHVRRVTESLELRSPLLRERSAAGRLAIVAAYYDLESGCVERLDS